MSVPAYPVSASLRPRGRIEDRPEARPVVPWWPKSPIGARVAVGRGLPMAFQVAIAIDPMTSQRRGWNPPPALRAANTRKVVIGRGFAEKPGSAQRGAPRLQRPESCKFEVCQPENREPEICKPEVYEPEICKSGFCECFEHRSPPLPLCAAGR
jgi:hypothetical protein